jgi:hypothetical protein
MKTTFLYPILLLVLISSACKSKKDSLSTFSSDSSAKSSVNPADKKYFLYKQDTLSYLIPANNDTTGHSDILKVVLKMETLTIDANTYSIYQTREFFLDKESELIIFNDQVGVKFFRTSIIEFGLHKNYYKYQLFTFENGQWKMCRESTDMSLITITKNRLSNLMRETTSVSSSSENLSFAMSFSFLKP